MLEFWIENGLGKVGRSHYSVDTILARDWIQASITFFETPKDGVNVPECSLARFLYLRSTTLDRAVRKVV